MPERTYKPGDKPWYLYRSLGSGMTHQEQVEVVAVKGEKAKIKRTHRTVWVKIKNLRPTS